jgi:NitT/TauT family transport system substrate-binding protein
MAPLGAGELEVSVIFYNKDWARTNDRVVKMFTVTYVKGSRFYDQAWVTGKNKEELIDILIKHTRLKKRALYDKITLT